MANWLTITHDMVDSSCGSSLAKGVGNLFYTANPDNWVHYVNETHWFILDLGSSYTITKVRGNSQAVYDPTSVNVYVSDDKEDFGIAVSTTITSWHDTADNVEVDVSEKTGRYVKVEITDTEGTGEYDNWLIWGPLSSASKPCFGVYGEINGGGGAPSKATNPTPANNATEVDFTGYALSWDDGGDAETFNVYIGESGSPTLVSAAQFATSYTTSMSELRSIFGKESDELLAQKIYWRVDATNGNGTTTGDEWNFDPRPGKASSPSPANEATDENAGLTLSWTAGTNAVTETVNGGETGSIEELETENESAEYGWSLGWGTEYQWRIDSVNAFGTTTGDVWSFTTVSYDPPLPAWENLPGKTLGPLTGGTEGTDFRWLGTNCMSTVKKLVVAAGSALWYEDR